MSEPAAKDWHASDGMHIDVRGLAPPNPMVAILQFLQRKDVSNCVIVHLDREPIFLYPELAERGWRHEMVPGESGEVRLLLTRLT